MKEETYRIITPWGQVIDTLLETRQVVKVLMGSVPNNTRILHDPDVGVIYVALEDLGQTVPEYNLFLINGERFTQFDAECVIFSHERFLPPLRVFTKPPNTKRPKYEPITAEISMPSVITDTMLEEFWEPFHGEVSVIYRESNTHVYMKGWITEQGRDELRDIVFNYAGSAIEIRQIKEEE